MDLTVHILIAVIMFLFGGLFGALLGFNEVDRHTKNLQTSIDKSLQNDRKTAVDQAYTKGVKDGVGLERKSIVDRLINLVDDLEDPA